jgi:hypothetical protein
MDEEENMAPVEEENPERWSTLQYYPKGGS